MKYSAIIAAVAAAVLTPVIMALWSKYAPPAKSSEFDHMDWAELHRRNNRIDVAGQFLAVVGIVVPLVLMNLGIAASLWMVGLGFGLMVILPLTFFFAVTYREGMVRHREFWRFYELKWNVSLRSLAWLYVPLCVLGVVSFIMVLGHNL